MRCVCLHQALFYFYSCLMTVRLWKMDWLGLRLWAGCPGGIMLAPTNAKTRKNVWSELYLTFIHDNGR